MAQIILIGNAESSASLAVAQAGALSTLTVYFDDQVTTAGQTNSTAGVLDIGDILYTTYTPADQTDPDPLNWTTESYADPYDPTGTGVLWHFATDSLFNQLTINIEGDDPSTIGEVLAFNAHSYDTLTSSVANVDEGGSVIFTVATNNIPDGTEVDYTVSGTGIDANDFTAGSLTGTITINSDTGSVTFTLAEDTTTEGAETLTLTLAAEDDNGVTTGTLTHDVTINDTSETALNPPDLADASFTVTQNGTPFTDSEVIDLSGLVTNGVAPYTWEIETLPANGTLRDNATPGTDITQVPYTLTVDGDGNNYKVIYLPGNTGAPSSVSFTYSAEDTVSTQTAVATITGSIAVPANQAPTIDPQGETFTASTIGIQKFFERSAEDEDENTLTFDWVTAQNGNTTQTEAQLNASLSHGQISQTNGENYVYTSSTVLNPGDSTVNDTFYFKATDSDGLSAVGQIQYQLTAPGNTAPTWRQNGNAYTAPGNPIAITAGTPFTVTGLTATDADQNQTIQNSTSVDPNGNDTGSATANYNASTQTFSVNGVTAGLSTVTLTANDGIVDATLTYSFTITEVPYRGIQYSTFSNSDQSACALARSTGQDQYYYQTGSGGTTFLANLQVGDFIYEDNAFAITVIPPSASSTWISVEETIEGTVKALQLNAATGAIESILNCTTAGGFAWPLNVNYNASTTNYCGGTYETGEAWQNIADGATLAQVVAAGGQLFSSEYYANQYSGSTAPSAYILAEGCYSEVGVTAADKYHYYDVASGWVEDSGNPGSFLYDCPEPVVYVTKSLDVRYYSADPTNIGAVCNNINGVVWADSDVNFDLITVWYRRDTNESDKNLLQLAQNKTQIFTSSAAADSQDYSSLQPSSVLLDEASGNFALWDNDNYTGYDGSYNWFAFDIENVLEQADSGSQLGTCGDGIGGSLADYQRDGLWAITQDLYDSYQNLVVAQSIQVGTATGSDSSIFFAFYACEAQLDGGSPYYPVYIVDGMVDYVQFRGFSGGVSYINDFIKTMTGNSSFDARSQVKIGGKCFTYTNYITATNIEEAVDLMQAEIDIIKEANITGGGSNNAGDMDAVAVSINAIDLGLGSQASVVWRNFTQGEEGTICYSCASGTQGTSNNWDTYVFPAMDNAEILDRTIPNFNLEENYILDNVSKPLLRTNPKLSTNAKLVANSVDQIFIESINATKELASVEYKKWALNPEGDWSQDLYRFYKSSSTPAKIMYSTRADYSDFTVQDSFDKQVEEVYHYGTTYNYSKLHTEELRMLAPIWLDKDIPNKFIIFRVNDPVGEMDFDTRTNFDNLQAILKNSEIIKSFDLTTDSSLGKYIRKHVNSESFPKSPVQFNFEKREKSSFNGIDLGKGGFTSKGEYLYKDFVRADGPLIASNEMITDGFERNKLACANLINIEFLFDDNNASDYSVNRYFGLYVNDIDSGYGNISSANNGDITFKSLNSYINDIPKSAIPSFKQISLTPTLGYLNISDEFYKISSKAEYDTSNLNVIVEDENNKIPAEVKTAPNDKSVDVVKNDLPGFDFVKFTVTGTPAVNDRFTVFESRESVYSIKFLRHIPNETWKMDINIDGNIVSAPAINIGASVADAYAAIKALLNNVADKVVVTYDINKDPRTIYINEVNATLEDLGVSFLPVGVGTSSIAKVTQMQTSVNLDNSTFFATHSLDPGTYNGNFYSLDGTTSEIAKAIVGCINGSSINFDAIIEDGASEFYVKNRVSGYRLLQSGILIPINNANTFITLNNRDVKTVNDPNGLLKLSSNVLGDNFVHYMNGGNSSGKSVLVTKDSVSDIVIGDMLPTIRLLILSMILKLQILFTKS